MLGSFDRFTVGSVVGAVGLGYYSGASEGTNRFLLIPVTAFSAMLPALSAIDAHEGRERALSVTRAGQRQLAAVTLPLCLVLFAFGPAILRLWLGPAFADAAGLPLRILSIGVFIAGLAILPLALLYGSGRPDLPAKINLIQVALHLPVTIILVRALGLTGAAIAVTLLRIEDLVFYEWARRRAIGRYLTVPAERAGIRALIAGGLLLSASFAVAVAVQRTDGRLAFAIALAGILLYAGFCWLRVLSPRERTAWISMVPG